MHIYDRAKSRVMLQLTLDLVIILYSVLVATEKEFSLARYSDTAVYPNNSAIDFNLVGEGFEGAQITGGGALECHTDDTTCCREIDNPLNGTGRGEWYYPDGTVVPPYGTDIFYITRDRMVIRLNYIVNPETNPKPGLFKCEIPGAGGSIIRTIELTRHFTKGVCNDLPEANSSVIVYIPPRDAAANQSVFPPVSRRFIGTIATYSCSPGYQLVGGSSLRACGPDGTWNGTQPSCEAKNCGDLSLNNGTVTYSESPLTELSDQRYAVGTIATYSCSPGYQLVKGSSLKVCGPNGTWNGTQPLCQGSVFIANSSSDCEIVVGISVVWIIVSMVIILLLVVYNLYLRKLLKQKTNNRGSVDHHESGGGSSAPQYEGIERTDVEYEEIDKVREGSEKQEQPHPHQGDYELTQCAAYGPVNRLVS